MTPDISEPNPANSYDLTAAEELAAARARGPNLFLIGVTSVQAVLWVVVMLVVSPGVLRAAPAAVADPDPGWWVLGLYAAVIAWGLVIVGALGFLLRGRVLYGGRGPVRMEISEQGLRFSWSSGAARLESWSGPKTRLIIDDFSESGDLAELKVGRMPTIALSPSAGLGIMAEARRRGLAVSAKETTNPWGVKGTRTVIRRSR